METIDRVRRDALKALIPPPKIPLGPWIEQNMRLPSSVAENAGKVRLWPPQVGIAEAISDSGIERVTLVKGIRVGFTTLLTGMIASFVSNDPSPILVLLPTEADARRYMTDDIEPIFEASPALHGLLSVEADDSKRSTILSRRFTGGSLRVVAAKAPRNLRSHNVRILLQDEIDAMEMTKEGDPTKLAENRTLSFSSRKIIKGSSPVYEDGPILRSYSQSDMRVFECPCPHCGSFFEILWKHIKWEVDKPETAACECPHCKELIDERNKAGMIAAAQWRATAPDVKGHAGFRLNALVSNLKNAAWGTLATEFLEAKRNTETLQVFNNTILAEGWRGAGEELDETGLMGRVEPLSLQAIPEAVLYITAGVDVQDDRLEITFLGFSKDQIFVLSHQVIWGNSLDNATWIALDELLLTKWRHPKGGQLGVECTLIDSGDGGVTDTVYSFVKPRFSRHIYACKGVAGKRPIAVKSETKKAPLFIVGVDEAKSNLFNRLTSGSSIRFSDTLGPEYFSQLTSERKKMTYSRGQPMRTFERKTGYRAEGLDCFVYAYAAKHLVNVNVEIRAAQLALETLPNGGIKAGAVYKSNWLEGHSA
jgi:phage terminase large subunit GpA-like protein